jgi:hypothetical protein
VLSRRDLLSLGYTPAAIEHRITSGRLHPIHRGVYAVGRPGVTRHGRWMAAVLACGTQAALSHRSAGALWDITEEGPATEVSVRQAHRRRRTGIHARRRPSLQVEDLASRTGIPVTSPARTLVDLATVLDARALERAVNEADKRDLIGPQTLRDGIGRFAGEPGVGALRDLVAAGAFLLSDSDLEISFRSVAEGAGLPPPLTKAWVNGFEVDFYWPALALVVETDGLRYHRTPSAQARDRRRDQAHTAAGLTALRFTHWQIRHEGAHVRKVLRATLSARPPPAAGA